MLICDYDRGSCRILFIYQDICAFYGLSFVFGVQLSNEQVLSSLLVNLDSDLKGYSRGANIAIGLGEMLLGVGFYIGSTLAAGAIEVSTEVIIFLLLIVSSISNDSIK